MLTFFFIELQRDWGLCSQVLLFGIAIAGAFILFTCFDYGIVMLGNRKTVAFLFLSAVAAEQHDQSLYVPCSTCLILLLMVRLLHYDTLILLCEYNNNNCGYSLYIGCFVVYDGVYSTSLHDPGNVVQCA